MDYSVMHFVIPADKRRLLIDVNTPFFPFLTKRDKQIPVRQRGFRQCAFFKFIHQDFFGRITYYTIVDNLLLLFRTQAVP